MTRSRQTADWGSRAGLAKIVPSSVAVGSGTGSSDTLGNVTFSGCSSVSLNNVFSSVYDNYKIIVDFVASTSTVANLRLRTTSDDSNALYQRQYVTFSGATTAYLRNSNQTTWAIQLIDTPRQNYEIGIGNPNLAIATGLTCSVNRNYNTTSNDVLWNYGGHNSSTQFTGFTFYSDAGTITGNIRVYGITQ